MLLDSYVLSAGNRSGIYRNWSQIVKRLLMRDDITTLLLARDINEIPRLRAEMAAIDSELSYDIIWGEKAIQAYAKSSNNAWIVLPFGVPPKEWQDIKGIRYAHYCNDLIAISNPEFFTHEAHQEVVSICEWLKKVDIILAISEHTKQEIGRHLGVKAQEKTIIAYCAADANIFNSEAKADTEEADVKNKLGLNSNHSYVLSVSTIEIRKNLETCVRAYSKLRNMGRDDIHLVLTGMNGWKTEGLMNTIEMLDSKSKAGIVFTGFVSDKELALLYRNASCFWYMSKAEGFGLPPLESMMCTTPVICSNRGSLPEVVGKGGILCDPNDYTRLALETIHIIDNSEHRETIAIAALTQASKFNWDKSVDNILQRLEFYSKSHPAKNIFPAPRAVPLISFITVTYNAEATLSTCINSIALAKHRVSCEYILVDGNSSDGTPSIVKRYGNIIDKILIEDDNGIYDAMNKGLKMATGKYICFVNADDEVNYNGVARIAALLQRDNSSTQILATSAAVVGETGTTRWVPEAPGDLAVFKCPNICHNGLYVRRDIYERNGYYDATFKIAGDSDWILRASMRGFVFEICDIVTYIYRLGGASSNFSEHSRELTRIARRTYPLLPQIIIQHLFYYNFTWQDRKKLFLLSPTISLAECMISASQIYAYFPLFSNGSTEGESHTLAQLIYNCKKLPLECKIAYMLREAGRVSSCIRLKQYVITTLALLAKSSQGSEMLMLFRHEVQCIYNSIWDSEILHDSISLKAIAKLENITRHSILF